QVGADGLIPWTDPGEDVRRHVIGVCRSRRDFSVRTGCTQTFLGQQGIVVAVDDVVGYARMLGLVGENRLEDFAALALIGKGLVGFGCGYGQGERVENGRLAVVGIGGLHVGHLLLERLGVGVCIVFILAV